MAEVMNRAARRADKAASPSVETAIYVVPMKLTGQYYLTQIAREGVWNDDPPVLVISPQAQTFRADDAWFRHTLDQMHEVRRPGTNRYVFPAQPDRAEEIDIDIGLIDVQMYFDTSPAGRPPILSSDERYRLYGLNLRQLKRLCGKKVHNQMVIATAIHQHRPDGSHAPHFHNLIFALRKQVEPDEHIGILQLLPLVKHLGDGRTLNIIAEL